MPNRADLLFNLSSLIQHQSLALSGIVNNSSLLNQKIDDLGQALTSKPKIQNSSPEEQFDLDGIFTWLSSDRAFTRYISLLNCFPEIIYKEKGFHLHLNVTSLNGETVVFPTAVSFIIALFTMENPPKLLKSNISGKKILRGSSEAVPDADGTVHFWNVVVNEVTSHYPNDSFCFVILCPSMANVKPLALSGIPVRARKHNR